MTARVRDIDKGVSLVCLSSRTLGDGAWKRVGVFG